MGLNINLKISNDQKNLIEFFFQRDTRDYLENMDNNELALRLGECYDYYWPGVSRDTITDQMIRNKLQELQKK
jgi:hypothetical protein